MPGFPIDRPRFTLRLPGRTLGLGERTLVMGVLNVTPDSFSDGGRFLDPALAIERGREMEQEGADLIDVGGESTRPGSRRVPLEEELRRVLPVIEGLRKHVRVPLSVDTWKAEVAARAVAAGAAVINHVALGETEAVARVAARTGAALLLMHVRGEPETMQRLPPMADVVGETAGGLRDLRDQALAAGVPADCLLLDPGFGFGKNGAENYVLLAGLARLQDLGRPLVVGTSRKAFLGENTPAERVFGTAATVAAAVLAGAHIVRVHDVKAMVQVARVADQILLHAKMAGLADA